MFKKILIANRGEIACLKLNGATGPVAAASAIGINPVQHGPELHR